MRTWKTFADSWLRTSCQRQQLLRTGRPEPAKHFARSDFHLVPFSLLWGGFSLF